MTTTTTRGQSPAIELSTYFWDVWVIAANGYHAEHSAGVVGWALLRGIADNARAYANDLTWLVILSASWSSRHVSPTPAPVLPRTARPALVRAAFDAAAEAQAVEAVLRELVERTAGTRAQERYRRAVAALELGGVSWWDGARGLEVTRGGSLHQIHAEDGCSCRAGGWRCWASAVAEAVEIVAARAAERRPARRAA